MSCEMYVPEDGVCVWCREPVEEHRLVPCSSCGGHPFLPDPTDRSRLPVWLRRWVLCSCADEGSRWGGWIVRETGKPAEDEVLVEAGWRAPSAGSDRRREAA